MSRFWFLLELRMMEVVVTTGATRCATPVKSPPTNQHPAFYKLDALPVVQQCQSTKGKETVECMDIN